MASIFLVSIHEVNPHKQRCGRLASKTEKTSIGQVSAAILSLSEATTQRGSTDIPPNWPRLGEEASEDPERKVQEAAIETV